MTMQCRPLTMSLLSLAAAGFASVTAFSAVAALGADAPATAQGAEEGGPERILTTIVDPAKPTAESAGVAVHAANYIKQQKLPAETVIRVQLEEYYEPVLGVRRELHSLAPLNAQGQVDGLESIMFRWRGVIRSVTYKAGVKNGPETVYNDHKVTSVTPWVDGKIQGVRQVFNSGGKVASETPFVNGIESGESKAYDPDGSLVRVTLLKDGKREGDMTDYWPGTKQVKKAVPYVGGRIQGLVREFYLNGKPKREIAFKDGLMHGPARDFDSEGKLIKTIWYIKGDEASQADYEKGK
ncbi:MAG: toxin-antitoxin system YwqK family antitoxin [Planctomycetota bacterium]|nr:toxin-antitoxin system YwqK family antitoxin [Planctomycetota bacterium]